MFLLFTGCMDGNSGDFLDPDNPKDLAGVKVLSKPASYDFAEAVGDLASEYYYNLFARQIVFELYHAYEDNSTDPERTNIIFADETDNGFLSQENGITFPFVEGDLNQYYLYDSLRYTITSVETVKDVNGNITAFILTFDTNSAWNWTIDEAAYGKENFFLAANQTSNQIVSDYQTSNNVVTVTIDNINFYSTWQDIYNDRIYLSLVPNFAEFYALENGLVTHTVDKDGEDYTVNDYGISPFYKENFDLTEDAVNFFQDAVEYATYLFVLGYDYNDYVDGSGQTVNDAPLFEFTVGYTNGLVSDLLVGGWGDQPISIVDALGRVKELYQEYGGFVGITDKNKEQITNFVLDKMIGPQACEKDIFVVDLISSTVDAGEVKTLDPVQPEDLTFNRNYEKVVSNIVDYACTQAPIGYDYDYVDEETGEVGKPLYLDENYLASTITDYKGDYFGMSYRNDTDDEAFEHIAAAEYQSMILYPRDEQLGFELTDIWLAFEYYDDGTTPSDLVYLVEEGLTLNVGFRYYDSSANGGQGAYTFMGEQTFNVAYGKYAEFENPDQTKLYISEDAPVADMLIDEDVFINTSFNNDIGGGAINPFAGDEETTDETRSILISGNNAAKDYYMLNNSSSYGFYGTLNGQMFSQNTAGEDACDFIEVYFDVLKLKGVSGVNYNFKVALFGFYTTADMEGM